VEASTSWPSLPEVAELANLDLSGRAAFPEPHADARTIRSLARLVTLNATDRSQ
jgi:hypothetical protein